MPSDEDEPAADDPKQPAPAVDRPTAEDGGTSTVAGGESSTIADGGAPAAAGGGRSVAAFETVDWTAIESSRRGVRKRTVVFLLGVLALAAGAVYDYFEVAPQQPLFEGFGPEVLLFGQRVLPLYWDVTGIECCSSRRCSRSRASSSSRSPRPRG
jgi:hypothetical protein